MARKVVAMEAKLLAALSSQVSVSVSELCADLGISRQTFYKYRRRFAQEGPAGLAERSRRPRRSPQMIPAALEDEIVRLRKDLECDTGARSIAYHLARQGGPVPSPATIHRALVRRGQVRPQPHKAPRSKGHRFEHPLANGAWQIDATRWALLDGEEVWIMDVLDDHSRLLVAAVACSGPTAAAAWQAFAAGVACYGIPAAVMSDNGTCFTARFAQCGGEAKFERTLRELGVEHICSSPGHPQTCGKLERQHQTLKNWLANQTPAETFDELQAQLDAYRDVYNHRRPHSALGGATPMERWNAAPKAQPGDGRHVEVQAGLRRIRPNGTVIWHRKQIHIDQTRAGQQVLIIADGLDVTIHGPNGLHQRRTLDPTRTYQPSGRPPGRPRHNAT
jgi:transposase InsO family protein